MHIKRPKVLDGVTRARSRIITYLHFIEFASGEVACSARSKTMAEVDRTCFVIYTILSLSSGLSRHESRDAAIRFPRMSNWTLTRWENRSRNTRRCKTTNAKCRCSKVSLSVKHGRYKKKKEKEIPDFWASSMPISLIVLYSFISYTAIVINI